MTRRKPGEPRPLPPAEVKFYFDADVLGVAKVLVQLRLDITYPGDPGGRIGNRVRPPCPVTTTDVKDQDWIPEVAKRGWLIVTRDRHIRTRPLEIAAVRDFGARLVALSSENAASVFDQLEVLMCRWRDLERCLIEEPPFIYSATRSGMTPIPLGSVSESDPHPRRGR